MTAAESVNEEAVEAAAQAAFRRDYAPMGSEWLREHGPEKWHRELAGRALAAALPLLRPSDVPHLERRIRESIAGEARDFAEQWLYDGDNDAPLDGYDAVVDLAARIARGSSV